MDNPGSVDEHRPLLPSSSRMSQKSIEIDEPPQLDSDASSTKQGLHRGLSARQVQMIAIAGTIGKYFIIKIHFFCLLIIALSCQHLGTGLFLGTGRSLSQGGPASILICYSLIGFIVYITLLLLGELGTQYPIAGSFTIYSAKFFSPSYAFALSWNYWFNDAVSVASDLTAAQLVLQFWTDWHPWVISLIFLVFLLGVNATSVHSYGEMGTCNTTLLVLLNLIIISIEYILSLLKVVTIVAFILVGIIVNAGANRLHTPIGTSNWRIEGAPFVDGIRGFASVFVTASFACKPFPPLFQVF